MSEERAPGQLVFELVVTNKESSIIMKRARVPGGWLVVVYFFPLMSFKDASVTFYPDPTHQWDGGSMLESAETHMPEVEETTNFFYPSRGPK